MVVHLNLRLSVVTVCGLLYWDVSSCIEWGYVGILTFVGTIGLSLGGMPSFAAYNLVGHC